MLKGKKRKRKVLATACFWPQLARVCLLLHSIISLVSPLLSLSLSPSLSLSLSLSLFLSLSLSLPPMSGGSSYDLSLL